MADFSPPRARRPLTLYEFLREEEAKAKPLPELPSPTLTNPDMVLPSEIVFPTLPSPQENRGRPPSLSYLRDQTNGNGAERSYSRSATPKKEKRGLMSRKMMLLRSRTGSGMNVNMIQQQQREVSAHQDTQRATTATPEDNGIAFASSPTLMDVGNLAPETPEEPAHFDFEQLQPVQDFAEQSPFDKRASVGGSSLSSDGTAGIPSFMAKYDATDGTTTDDELFESDSPAQQRMGYSVSIEGSLNAHRRQQEEDEHNSALLSKRAERILANAKKRLNLMEGNLRGARDLVIPLTAANLKRATSVGSSLHYSSSGGGGRFTPEGFRLTSSSQQRPKRALHSQASSPTMGRDLQGHLRGFSESEMPENPSPASGRRNGPLRSERIPVKTNDGSWIQGLRSSKSYDSLESSENVRQTTRGRPLRALASPEPMESLAEDDGSQHVSSARNSKVVNGLGIYRPASRTDDLREQIGTLKGKISSLKERALEDNLKRQGTADLRTTSPFNNAISSPPEYFYVQSPTHDHAACDTNKGVGRVSQDISPMTQHIPELDRQQSNPLPGNRNAFVERAAEKQQVQARDDDDDESPHRKLNSETRPDVQHKRTASGTAIIESASNRYSHHQLVPGWDTQTASWQKPQINDQSSAVQSREFRSMSPSSYNESLEQDHDHEVFAEEQESVYADAEYEQPPVVAHEDRDDAFNYGTSFLAVGGYRNEKRGSMSSEQTASSVSTARGPTAVTGDEDDFNPGSGMYPPPTPETPERLREIERALHRRTFSEESVSTIASFATAVDDSEHSILPQAPSLSRQASALDWPIQPSGPKSLTDSRPSSRPTTAIQRTERRRDTSSERADSGIGLSRRSNSSHDRKRTTAPSSKSPQTTGSNPSTPGTPALHDPATLMVNSLLNPAGRQLGLKDKALLFGLVENLRMVCDSLQSTDEAQYEGRVLRRRLDDAKRALGGELMP